MAKVFCRYMMPNYGGNAIEAMVVCDVTIRCIVMMVMI